jgi:predicted nucleotide-binding protein (sugar kinase/HSP70/actin superfamily)
VKLGRQLDASLLRIFKAYTRAAREQRRYEELLLAGLLPSDALERLYNGNGCSLPSYLSPRDVSVAVVGHPYLLGDALVNKRLVHWLDANEARVICSTMLDDEVIENESEQLTPISWSYEKELLAAVSHFLKREDIDGVIYLTSFGCGPDSMITEIARRELEPSGGQVLLEMVLDEHSAESGIRTRAEAFVDMLRYRKGSGCESGRAE